MKYVTLLALFFMSCLMVSAEFTEEEMDRLRDDVEIAGTRTDTWKNDDREKYEVLTVNTFQNEDDPLDFDMSTFRIRLVVELIDKSKTKYFVQFTGSPSNDYDSEYEGQDYWIFRMAHGDLERLKINGFAVQYGVMDGETFLPLAQEEDNYEDILEGLRARTTKPFPNDFYLWHYYIYEDSVEGSAESTPSNVRAIK